MVNPFILPNIFVKFLPAPSGAIFVELPISDRISIQPELAFTQKGFVINESFNVGGGDNLLGLNIPIGGRIALKNNHLEDHLFPNSLFLG